MSNFETISTLRKNFKIKEIKCYCDNEWLDNYQKKYRQVFDKHELSFIYVELSLYNKKFEEEDWPIEIELKCKSEHENGKLTEICSIHINETIYKNDAIAYLREGWGNKLTGTFWQSGNYCWEIYVNGHYEGKKSFYISDADIPFTESYNPYFEVETVKLYEGPYGDVMEDDRIYYTEFNTNQTRLIYLEANFSNTFTNGYWPCEVFIKIFNQNRDLKAQITKFLNINEGDSSIGFTVGWGSNQLGNWRKGKYTFEIIFLDCLIGVIPFEVSEQSVLGIPTLYTDFVYKNLNSTYTPASQYSTGDILNKLNSFIGLDAVKNQIKDHTLYLKYLELRRKKGIQDQSKISLHSVFVGNPGTGKTTVAQFMGQIYKDIGFLSKGHIHEVDRVDLIGEFIGQTAPKVRSAIESAKGGVLFIDEAYALARTNDDSKDFGREVIEILVKEMSNPECDFAVIVAGYPKEMEHFLNSNPGLKSRFKLFFHFPDYLPQELSQIADLVSEEFQVNFTPKAKASLDHLIIEAFRNKNKSFGNARFVRDLVEKAKVNLGIRLMSKNNPEGMSPSELSLIRDVDIKKIGILPSSELPNIPIDEQLLEAACLDLNNLTGIENIKKEIIEIIEIIKFHRIQNTQVLNHFYFHTMLIGNPGTGKTTVSRILAKVFKALGLLERGHLVETDRQGLVAGYIGQTAIKTNEKIDEAMGGVLFIDEAYSLISNTSQDYGAESIQVILKRMEDDRGKFFVFTAGYPSKMEAFIKSNPGLASRFDRYLYFEDYDPDQLTEIALNMLKEKKLSLSPKAKEYLIQYINQLYSFRDQFFGNARTIRKITDEIIKKYNLRQSRQHQNIAQRAKIITIEDVQMIEMGSNEIDFNRQRIGYKK